MQFLIISRITLTHILLLIMLQFTLAIGISEVSMLEEEQGKRNTPLASYFSGQFSLKGELAKRSEYATSPIIRFGKRSGLTDGPLRRELRTQQHMMDPLIRFGKRAGFQGVDTPLIRFGKRTVSPSAFSSTPHIRFGKRNGNSAFAKFHPDVAVPIASYYGELDNTEFSRFRRPNPIEEDTMLRFG